MTRARLLAYCRSRQHLVGCCLALFGAALVFVDPVGPSGVVLVLGFYGLGVLAGRPPDAGRVAFDPVHADEALDAELAELAGRVPREIMGQLYRIKDVVRFQVLPGLDGLPAGSLDRYLLEKTLLDYLPSAVENYVLAAPEHATDQPSSTGVAAKQNLEDQLSIIEADMRRIAGVVQQRHLDRMLAQHRFLSERLGRIDPSG